MVKAIEQLRRDLNILVDKVMTVRQNLHNVYGDYLDTLGSSLEKQLVLAGFQLSTQVYPDNLLAMSYDQREKMQQQLRVIAQETHAELCRIPHEPDTTPSDEEEEAILLNETILAADADNVEQELLEVFESIDEAIADSTATSEDQPDHPDAEPNSETQKQRTELSQLAERIAASISEMMQVEEEPEPLDEGSPEALIEDSRQLEKRIKKTLRHCSKTANRLFQEAGILPKHIPQKVLDMALQNERPSNSNTKINNLVTLVVEADHGDKKKKRRTQMTAIDLKIAEIEFGDPQVIAQRSRIREQIAKAKQLAKYYKKISKELTIAEAEAAWRSSWHEGKLDPPQLNQ